ncbi:MAG: isoprenyl transferase [Rhodospirillales bacterium]|nr:isoprenyl transferase [Alphaproteobacteria bacterium]MBL6947846.1 isoprenyl transferase [Rhodospirillales bacterium]
METVSLQKKDQPPAPPEHIAIIMDGNGRWAQAKGLPRTVGHQRGADAVRNTVKASIALGVRYLTLFGFSSENWKRPAGEIKDLMGLLRFYLKKEISELDRQGICLKVIGDRERLEPDIVSLIDGAEIQTAGNTRLTLTIALSYGGRSEITAAARRIAEDVLAGTLAIGNIDEAALSSRLYTADMPDPDLLIRTSGEERISNFLLWQLAYSELVFTDVLWPDFSEEHLTNAVQEFHNRERRYGATGG